MRARAVAVRFFIGPDGKLGNMAFGIVFGHLEHGVDTAGTPLLPAVEQHVRRVGDEVGFPDAPGVELALAAEIIVLARVAAAEHVIAVKDKIIVAKQAHHWRRVGYRDVARRLVAAAVEILVGRVERNREQTPSLPLETVLALAVGAVAALLPDGGGAAPRDDIDGQLIEMMLRLGLPAGLDFDYVAIV